MTMLLGLLGNRWVQYGLLIGAFFLFWRWSTNKAYDQGVGNGRIQATAELEKAKQKEWAQKEEEIKAQLQMIDDARGTLDQAKADLNRARAIITSSLTKTLAEIRDRETANNAAVSAVPAAELDDALRAVSTELATGKPAQP